MSACSRAALTVLIVLASTVPAGAQDLSLSGVLLSEGGSPLIGAPLVIEPVGPTDPASNKRIIALTNDEGRFSVFNLGAGEYVASVLDRPEVAQQFTIEQQSFFPFLWSDTTQAADMVLVCRDCSSTQPKVPEFN